MYLTSLTVRNYRNIHFAEFSPSPGLNVLWGDNGQGKTNFIEIIYLLGTLKSFRGGSNADLIKNGEEEGRLKAVVASLNIERDVSLHIAQCGKKLLFDGKPVKDYQDYFACLRPILFAPEEVMVIKGPPALRRSLVDRAIFQTSPAYLQKVRAYETCLRQRNKGLQENLSAEEIHPWTERLIVCGAAIRLERSLYLQRLSPLFREAYRRISDSAEEARFDYRQEGIGQDRLQESLRRELAAAKTREMRQRLTLAGPHRDDVDFFLDGKIAKNYGSQGQQRSCILAFKTAQVMDLEAHIGDKPVLLLDDLSSELDAKRKDFYLDFLSSHSGQVFITTTDQQLFAPSVLKDTSYFKVDKGRIIPNNEMR